jgi:hypothetical protein
MLCGLRVEVRMLRQNLRSTGVTLAKFQRAQIENRLPPGFPSSNLSLAQITALAIWNEVSRRVSLSARASRTVVRMGEQFARDIHLAPECWLFVAASTSDDPEPACGLFQHPVKIEPNDGLRQITIVPLLEIVRGLLARIDASSRGTFVAEAA